MTEYNGHRSWNAWNVALWIGNDESLYTLALECKRSRMFDKRPVNTRLAARRFLARIGDDKTPDGAKYNLTCVREALADLE